ncbi:MAG: 3-dehydroquinate synthase, partial [Bacteroidetes bacterium]|nr:3-dehydroquinate synthase [Bacteroidota bacterium]
TASSLEGWLGNKNVQSTERFIFLVDEHVEDLHQLIQKLNGAVFTIKAGEEQKSISTVMKVWAFLGAQNADRNTHIISIGGGVVSDLAGFVASTYMRGIGLSHIPTTLLAMVDAVLGGKTGINLSHWKNRVGTFYFPREIVLDLNFLHTLPREEWKNGWAEVLKHAIIDGDDLLTQVLSIHAVETCQSHCSYKFIRSVMQVKVNCVQADVYDRSIRQKLNAGHTVGHALESFFFLQGKRIHHGRAVAAGLWVEAEIAFIVNGLPAHQKRVLQTYIEEFFDLPLFSEKDIMMIIDYMKGDKKNRNFHIYFSLLYDWGDVRINQRIEDTIIKDALRSYCNTLENS